MVFASCDRAISCITNCEWTIMRHHIRPIMQFPIRLFRCFTERDKGGAVRWQKYPCKSISKSAAAGEAQVPAQPLAGQALLVQEKTCTFLGRIKKRPQSCSPEIYQSQKLNWFLKNSFTSSRHTLHAWTPRKCKEESEILGHLPMLGDGGRLSPRAEHDSGRKDRLSTALHAQPSRLRLCQKRMFEAHPSS